MGVNEMKARQAPGGYFLDPTKSILVVALRNVPRAEEFFRGMEVEIATWSRYPGVFVGDGAAEDSWIAERVQGWA